MDLKVVVEGWVGRLQGGCIMYKDSMDGRNLMAGGRMSVD